MQDEMVFSTAYWSLKSFIKLTGLIMQNKFITLLAVLLAFVLSGCATSTKMAFQNDADRLSEKSKPVYLMMVTLKNTYQTSYQPRLAMLVIEKPDAKWKSDRLHVWMDEKAKNETNSATAGNNYMLRLELDAGHYELRGLDSAASSFLILGRFFTPLHLPLEVTNEPGVYYLGHVVATVRERIGNEFQAGLSFPLIDQAVVGASGGTFDVEVSDNFAIDEPLFKAKFPALADITIQKKILPPFDRVKAQRWWEAH